MCDCLLMWAAAPGHQHTARHARARGRGSQSGLASASAATASRGKGRLPSELVKPHEPCVMMPKLPSPLRACAAAPHTQSDSPEWAAAWWAACKWVRHTAARARALHAPVSSASPGGVVGASDGRWRSKVGRSAQPVDAAGSSTHAQSVHTRLHAPRGSCRQLPGRQAWGVVEPRGGTVCAAGRPCTQPPPSPPARRALNGHHRQGLDDWHNTPCAARARRIGARGVAVAASWRVAAARRRGGWCGVLPLLSGRCGHW
jgi:hypothetical protein